MRPGMNLQRLDLDLPLPDFAWFPAYHRGLDRPVGLSAEMCHLVHVSKTEPEDLLQSSTLDLRETTWWV